MSWTLLAALAGAQPSRSVTKIAGQLQYVALLSDGAVLTWGDGNRAGPVTVALPGRAVDVAVATNNGSYAVLEDGSVFEWAAGKFATPARVAGLSNITQIAASTATVALARDGSVYAWGTRESGMIGDGQHPQRYGQSGPPAVSPVKVPGVSDIVQIAVGDGHVLALKADGTVMSWGSNSHGALGRPPRRELPMDAAAPVPGLTNVAALAAGRGVSTVLKKDGTVWVWGGNQMAQFGNGRRVDPPGVESGWELKPQQVPGIANVTALTLGLIGRHTLVLLKDGTLRGWGNTDWGQIGAGVSGQFHESPVMPKISGVKAVFAVGTQTYAVRTDNTVWVWGLGRTGEWPLATNTKLPVKIDLN